MTKKSVGRPRKQDKDKYSAPFIKGRYFRLVIPNLTDYANDSQALKILKGDTLKLLLEKQTSYGLQSYKIAVELHPTTLIPHLDILLIYKATVRKSLNRFNYLVKHGNLTNYRKLNQAILAYGDKEDLEPLTNITDDKQVLMAKALQSDPFVFLKTEMMKNPFKFDVVSFIIKNKLEDALSRTNYYKAISLLKLFQQHLCNDLLKSKQNLKFIDRTLIQQRLTLEQLKIYDSWSGYQKIVDYINQIVLYGYKRPFKSKNLYITGPAHVGKTSLFSQPNHLRSEPSVEDLVSTYHMGMKHWFPKFKSETYGLIFWDQFKITSYSYDMILKFLQGSPIDLPYHGGATKKMDNPLIVMTSNLPLQRHIQIKFSNHIDQEIAKDNLSKRIQQITIPAGYDLFLLRKLILSTGPDIIKCSNITSYTQDGLLL